jgi:dodecin
LRIVTQKFKCFIKNIVFICYLSPKPLPYGGAQIFSKYKEFLMSDPTYKKIELTGTSEKSIEDAVNNAIVKASESVRKIRWFEVKEVRGSVAEGQVHQWQVTVKIGFRLED